MSRPLHKRKPSAAPRGDQRSPNSISQRIVSELPGLWVKREHVYGRLTGPWVPSTGFRSVGRKLALLTITLTGSLLWSIGGRDWNIDLDDQHEPTALILSRTGDTHVVVPIEWRGTLVRIGSTSIGLTSRDAGERLTAAIATACGIYFASPLRGA